MTNLSHHTYLLCELENRIADEGAPDRNVQIGLADLIG
jgi:hypothetical protein